MYQPAHFQVDDPNLLYTLIERFPLGLLITSSDAGLVANPLPFLLVRDIENKVTLQTHMARANSQWQEIADNAIASVVFQGPGHYISPNWYPSKQLNNKVVPTWNYATVQISGEAVVNQDPSWLKRHVDALSTRQEQQLQQTSQDGSFRAWSINDAPSTYIDAQVRAIVGIEFRNPNMQGKFKLSQNRQLQDRQGVISNLEDNNHRAREVAHLMRQLAI